MHRRPYLDGVRGLAALIVIFGHCSNAGFDIIPGLHLRRTGTTGVWVFFGLSAFLLASQLIEAFSASDDRRRVLWHYVARRIYRILPLYYLTLTAVMLAGWFSVSAYLRHLVLINGQAHFWTIPVEMSFYLVLPAIALWLSRMAPEHRPLAGAAIFVISVPIRWAGQWLNPEGHTVLLLLNYAPFFAAGILAAVLPPIRSLPATMLGLAGLVLLAVLAPPALGPITGIPLRDVHAPVWLLAAASAALLAAVGNSRLLSRAFGIRLLRWVGRVSFSAYLFHWFVIEFFRAADRLPVPFTGPAILVLTLALATISFRFIEMPALRLGTRFADDLYRRRREAARSAEAPAQPGGFAAATTPLDLLSYDQPKNAAPRD